MALVFSLKALVAPPPEFVPPIQATYIGGASIIDGVVREAQDAGVELGERLVAVDGLPVLRAMRRPNDAWLRPGVPNSYTIERRSGERYTVSLAPAASESFDGRRAALLHVGLLLVAGAYLAIGMGVWWLKPDRAASWALLLFCSSMAALLSMIVDADRIQWSAVRFMIGLPLLGAATFHLFTTYPTEPDWVVRHRRFRFLPYGLVPLAALAALVEEPLGLSPDLLAAGAFHSAIFLGLASLWLLTVERRRLREGPLKDRADIMFVAAIVSFLPVYLIVLAQYVLRTPYPWYIAMLWVFVFPLAVGYGIVRKQLFEIRMLARSSAAYGAASLAITGLFAFMIIFASQALSGFNVNARSPWFSVTFLFIAILAFNPLRNRMQGLVDRVFDRDRAAYRRAVREISEAMVSMLSLREISDRILIALTDTMGVERAMVLLFDDEERMLSPAAWRGDWEEKDLETQVAPEHPIWKQLWMRREELSRLDFDDEPDPEHREQCRDVFDTLEVELLVPILFGVDLLGVIVVGRKLTGERLEADDRQLLRTLANQSSIAFENAKAFDEIAKLNATLEARVEERTRELRDTQEQLMQAEKLKSLGQLVAGVAHELNNPIGFVHANLQLLDEYTRKLIEGQRTESDTARIRDAITRLLSRSREGTERVKKIVHDLRTFSRMDQAELQEADLHEEIDRTLALMEPRLKDNIQVRREYGAIPRVRCYVGQLNQVFLNLLMNACDALEDGGNIAIRTSRIETGVRLEFADDGPGIPPEAHGRIFDPFFTTKPVGKGTGLGLSLSHGIIERHDGRIWVDSTPGGGTTFVIELPLDATPADE